MSKKQVNKFPQNDSERLYYLVKNYISGQILSSEDKLVAIKFLNELNGNKNSEKYKNKLY